MSDSVGKITLDLEVTSDLSKQISAMSNIMGKNLKESMNGATKTMFDGMNKSMDNSMKSVTSSLKSGLSKMKETISNTLDGAFAAAKTIKLPTVKFPKIDMAKPVTNNAISQPATRGPPIFNSEAIKAEMDNVSRTLDNTNAKIEQQQTKLAGLKESYATTFNDNRKNAIQEKILKTESAINSLINKSDKLGFKLADLDAKFASAGTRASEASSKINSLSNKTNNFTSKANGSVSVFKKLQNLFGGLESSAKSCDNSFNGMQHGLAMVTRQFLTWMVILPIIMKGLSAMASGLLADLNTNQEFVNSLTQIKTNLMVAFTPIFYAILPAINAFMSALATVTAYIASFISSIFGKTYQESFQATKGLIGAKDAMGAYGDSAKKAAKDAQGALMGFDEINQLDTSKSDGAASGGASKVPELVQPSLDTSVMDSQMQAMVDKIKGILSTVFQPFKDAWAAEGQNTMNAFKLALDNIWDLIKAIGQSFLTVWTNGTGTTILILIHQILQNILNIIGSIANAFTIAWTTNDIGTLLIQTISDMLINILTVIKDIGDSFLQVWNNGTGVIICTTILQILTNMFGIVSDIAGTFATAWESGSIGTQIIQGIANTISNLLLLIEKIGESLRNAFEVVGQEVSNTFMQVLNATIGVLENLTQAFIYVWDNGGSHLFEGFVNLGAKIFELAGYLYTEFITPLADGLISIVAPAFAVVMNAAGYLVDGISTLIGWLNQNKAVIDTIVIVLGSMALSYGLVTLAMSAGAIATGIWSAVCGVATTVTTALGAAIAFITSPIGIAILAIGALIAIGVLLYQNWDTVKVFLLATWDAIKVAAESVWNAIKDFFSNLWSEISDIATEIFTAISNFFAITWQAITDTITSMWTTITDFLSGIWTKISNNATKIFTAISNFLSTIWTGIKNFLSILWTEISNLASSTWNGIKTTCETVFNNLKIFITNIWEDIKKIFNGVVKFITDVFTGNWKEAWKGVVNAFTEVVNLIEGIFKKVLNGAIGVINNAVKGVVSAINTLINDAIDLLNKIPGIDISVNPITAPQIPLLAKGGVIDSPTLAMVGESGKEAVVPLENNTEWMDKIGQVVGNAVLGAMQFSNKSNNSNNQSGDIYLQVDGTTFARIIKPYSDSENQRTGKSVIIQTV